MIDRVYGVPVPTGGTVINDNTFTRSSNVRRSNILGGHRGCRVVAPRSVNLGRVRLGLASHSKHTTIGRHVSRVKCGRDRCGLSGLCSTFLGLTSGGNRIFSCSLRTLTFVNGRRRRPRRFHLSCFDIRSNSGSVTATTIGLTYNRRIGTRTTGNGNPISTICRTVGHVASCGIRLIGCDLATGNRNGSTLNRISVITGCGNHHFRNINLTASVIRSSTGTVIRMLGGV